jgi:DNA-binding MarR family transcriptional regulator
MGRMGARSKRGVALDAWWLMARFTMDKFQRGEHLAILREHGLTPGHMKTLSVLDPDQPRPMGVIADRMHCDASQMTWLVDRLEERGLAERRTLAEDRRVKTIALTPAGIAFRTRLMELMFEPPPELMALDAAALESLRDTLEQLPMPPDGYWFRPDRSGSDGVDEPTGARA